MIHKFKDCIDVSFPLCLGLFCCGDCHGIPLGRAGLSFIFILNTSSDKNVVSLDISWIPMRLRDFFLDWDGI